MALTKKSCDACAQCYLNITGGVCPIVDCSKSLVNGQLGAKNGKCEVDPNKDCAWEKIYRDWRTGTSDGQKIQGYEGEPIAAALKAAGILIHRYTKKEHTPRGIFCAIGRCTDCVMVVDGVPNVRTCVTPLKAGMKVQTQYGVSAEPFEEQKTGGQTR